MTANEAPQKIKDMSVEEIETAIRKHWSASDFYFAQVLAGECTVADTIEDLQSLINSAGAA